MKLSQGSLFGLGIGLLMVDAVLFHHYRGHNPGWLTPFAGGCGVIIGRIIYSLRTGRRPQ